MDNIVRVVASEKDLCEEILLHKINEQFLLFLSIFFPRIYVLDLCVVCRILNDKMMTSR